MIFNYSITFESASQAPETVKGTVNASTLSSASGKSIREAKKAKPTNNRWQSVVVLLEKVDSTATASN